MTLCEIEIKHRTRNYMKWMVEQWVEKQTSIFNMVSVSKNCVQLIPEGKAWKDRISIHKDSMRVIRNV